MKLPASAFFVLSLFLLSEVTAGQEDRYLRQQALDEACESARAEKLAPLRQRYIDECVRGRGRDQASCERFYSDYGDRSGIRPPLFYDLPECAEAFDYRRSYRRAN